MKRAHAIDGQRLKRAKCSLFSIATLVDDDPNSAEAAGAIAGLVPDGGKSPSTSLLLVGGGGGKYEEDASSAACSASRPPGLVTLDGRDDDALVLEESSWSSSELEEQEDGDEVARKSVQDEDWPADPAPFGLPTPVDKKSTSAPSSSSEVAVATPYLPRQPPVAGEPGRKDETWTAEPSDHRTGLVFESGSKHFDRHNRFHKERPLRVTSVRDYLVKAKPSGSEKTIFERCCLLQGCSVDDGEYAGAESKKNSEELWLDDYDYLRVHLPGFMQRLDRISKCNCHNRLDIEAEQFKSLYLTNHSVYEAKAAASSLCRLVSHVVAGELDNAFAVIRPPGHHAEPSLAGGYCIINNVAVAAAYAQEKLGMKKVLIVDWDVHHGNGTQRCFLDNPNILFFSVHRYHAGNFFPFLQHGGPTNVGAAAGEGFNVNVGWNDKRMGDDEYLVVWEKLLMPVASEFKPDLVLVSAGFDAAKGDMGECDVSPGCFARLTRRLKSLANGKVVCALEGGYVRSVLCKCVEGVIGSLLDANSDEKCKRELQTFYKNIGDNEMLDCIDPSAAKSIRETMKAHSKYWHCLKTRDQCGDV